MTRYVIMLATKREDSRKPQRWRRKEGTGKTDSRVLLMAVFVLTSVLSILHT